MAVTHKPVTAQELLAMPDDGLRRELVRGEVRKTAPAGFQHGSIAAEVAASLAWHVRSNGLGVVVAAETGFKIAGNPDTVRAPDAAFVSRERVEEADGTIGYWTGAPVLAVEVISPNDRFAEVEEKVGDWISSGCRMVLIVNPKGKNVTVRLPEKRVAILTEAETIDGGEVVPGWTLPVSELFR